MTTKPALAKSVPIVVVSGLSGAGKRSILHALEDIGFEAVDNPPLKLLETLAIRDKQPLAVGIDARTRGFAAERVLTVLRRLRENPRLKPELVFATAESVILQRRYTETRRRHPLAGSGSVADGIATETALTAPLRKAADWVIDTSDLPLSGLRRMIEQRFSKTEPMLTLNLVSFDFPAGLPREADMVFDARFLRNPHYIPALRDKTGLNRAVLAYIEHDSGYQEFLSRITGLILFLLPRFIQEGKKYATIAIGCTGGRHRSVALVEAVGGFLAERGWHARITHRALALSGLPEQTRLGSAQKPAPGAPERVAKAGSRQPTTGPVAKPKSKLVRQHHGYQVSGKKSELEAQNGSRRGVSGHAASGHEVPGYEAPEFEEGWRQDMAGALE
jgi:UPF0042 nucleotide-binding protein